ncbi:MAG: metallophosphoesterase family protein, partial [Vulcanimicrobiaceae bacterium]
DVHANLAALRALPPADAVVCAGDIVGLGPDAGGVIDELIRLGASCVRGDEDDAVAKGSAHPVPAQIAHAARELRERTRAALSKAQLRWLQQLPPELELTFDGIRVGVTHAYPGDYTRYIRPTEEEISRISRAFPHCEIVVIGHSHRQGSWKNRCFVVNPGSVGLPERAGYASYALLENGHVTFATARYNPRTTLSALAAVGISDRAYGECCDELTIGSIRPFARLEHSRRSTSLGTQ